MDLLVLGVDLTLEVDDVRDVLVPGGGAVLDPVEVLIEVLVHLLRKDQWWVLIDSSDVPLLSQDAFVVSIEGLWARHKLEL